MRMEAESNSGGGSYCAVLPNDADGILMWVGTWRVGGLPAVSRAFGDKLLKEHDVVDPTIQKDKVDSSSEFLILASDGLWDVVITDESVAVDILSSGVHVWGAWQGDQQTREHICCSGQCGYRFGLKTTNMVVSKLPYPN